MQLYFGGSIHPFADERTAEAVAFEAGKIVYVGNLSDAPTAERIDLRGRSLFAGFTDAHVHVWKVGQLRTTMLDVREASNMQEFANLVRERHAALPEGEWLWGRGWNEARLGFRPSRELLDELAPNRPVLLTRTCAHIHAVSSTALALAGITANTVAPEGGEIDFALGAIAETAYGLVFNAMPAPTQADYERWIMAGLEYLKSLGFTAATDPAVDPPLYAAYKALDEAGKLPIRTNLLFIRRPDGGTGTYPLPEKIFSSKLRCDSVKFFCDGGLSGATAAVSVPYKELGTKGVLRFNYADLYELAKEAHCQGFRIGAHAIGDVALDQLLSVYERLNAEYPNGIRHRIEHFGLASEKHLAKAKELNVISVPQPIFLHELRLNYQKYIPEALSGRVFPLKAMFEAGLDVAFSSDGPVVRELRPMCGIKAAVAEAYSLNQEVSTAQSLWAYTQGGAIAHGDQEMRGTLEVGKLADFTIISGNLFNTSPDEWADFTVQAHIATEGAY